MNQEIWDCSLDRPFQSEFHELGGGGVSGGYVPAHDAVVLIEHNWEEVPVDVRAFAWTFGNGFVQPIGQ